MLEIKPVTESDASDVVSVYLDVVEWLERIGKPWWTREVADWKFLTGTFPVECYRLAREDGIPVACMAVMDYDPAIWPEAPKGESLYIHRLAVSRRGSGGQVSRAMLDYVKQAAREQGIGYVRLDCNRLNPHLLSLYSGNGFQPVRDWDHGNYHATLFQYKLPEI